jgi:hypothetical protein
MTYRGLLLLLGLLQTNVALAEVVGVTITSRRPVAEGRSFGSRGAYEQLFGRIEFALDPNDIHNRSIVDLEFAPRDQQGRVQFSADLYVVQPVDESKANGVLLFEIANRGGRGGILNMFNRGGGNDPTTPTGAGDGFLMGEGYSMVWVGWEFDLPATGLRLAAPTVTFPPHMPIEPVALDLVVNQRTLESFIIDEPARPPAIYQPLEPDSASNRLTVRQRYWDSETLVPRSKWRFVLDPIGGPPKVHFDDGFAPGLLYRVRYQVATPVVAGVGLAAIRDAASAFVHRKDFPVHGRAALAYGNSQTGRFLRQYLYGGFNVDERDRRVFDALWSHIAGAARGAYNTRLAALSHGDPFAPTQFPFSDAEEEDTDGKRDGLQIRYRPEQRPKVFYTNTPVEYWGGGRAAALTHTSVDGTRDLRLPDNVRIYLLAGTQHISFPFPPDRRSLPGPSSRNDGQLLPNTTPQKDIMRALLKAFRQWAVEGVPPPPSAYPRVSDHTLVPVAQVLFPRLPGVSDPRTIVGPARRVGERVVPLPHLVPQVDRDGNEIAGIRDPDVAVPLATLTGWNFRHERVGNSIDIYQLQGAYIPFAVSERTRMEQHDPRESIEERYRDERDYLARYTAETDALIKRRLLLPEDRDAVLARGRANWAFATR